MLQEVNMVKKNVNLCFERTEALKLDFQNMSKSISRDFSDVLTAVNKIRALNSRDNIIEEPEILINSDSKVTRYHKNHNEEQKHKPARAVVNPFPPLAVVRHQ